MALFFGERFPRYAPAYPQKEEIEEGMPFFPNHWLKEVIVIFLVLGILLTLAIFFPFALHEKADPLSTPIGLKPEWYFLWVYQVLKYLPAKVSIIPGQTIAVGFIFGVLIFLQFVWPVLDNRPERHPKKRPVGMTIAVIVLTLGLLFTVLGILSERTVNIGKNKYHFDLYGIPHKVIAEQQVEHSDSIEVRTGDESGSVSSDEGGNHEK